MLKQQGARSEPIASTIGDRERQSPEITNPKSAIRKEIKQTSRSKIDCSTEIESANLETNDECAAEFHQPRSDTMLNGTRLHGREELLESSHTEEKEHILNKLSE